MLRTPFTGSGDAARRGVARPLTDRKDGLTCGKDCRDAQERLGHLKDVVRR